MEHQIAGRSFDGLIHSVRPDAGLLQRFRAAGYDPDLPQAFYPLRTWRNCLEAAREALYPGEAPAQAFHKVGRAWGQGFAKTLVGEVLADSVQRIGPEKALARFPSLLMTAREDMRVSVEALGTNHWRLVLDDPEPLPAFTAGIVEALMELTGVRPRLEVELESATRYAIHVRW